MTQVIDNILNNAIKYSPDGGKITVSMKTTDDQMILSIKDQGLGIPKQDLPKIFDRFYRVDRARSRAQGGTDLGLAIAKEIIKQHNGFIWAKSEYGKGSTFTIVLPYNKDAIKEEISVQAPGLRLGDPHVDELSQQFFTAGEERHLVRGSPPL